MKNALLALNLVLLVAVGVLFYLHFSGKKGPETRIASSNQNTASSHGDCRIAYFDMDSINNSFVLIKDVKAELSKEEE